MATTIADSGQWSDIADDLNTNFSALESSLGNKPDSSSLATIATTGDYDDLSNKPVLGTAAAQNTTAFATATQGGKADTAVQPADLGDLATKDEVGIAELSATGTPSGTTFLRGDNVWAVPPGGGGAAWGSISGTLADQTDLQAALDAKADNGDVFSGSYNDLTDTPSFSTVATSGDYDDLTNTPTPFSGSYNDLTDKPTLGTAAAADAGDFATAAQGVKADSAIQSSDLGELAVKDNVTVSDVNATGTADSTTFLRGDNTWAAPASASITPFSRVRQTVLTGPVDSDGRADFLVDGGGLSVDTSGLTTDSLLLSYGDGFDAISGEVNVVVEIDTDLTWSSLTDDDVNYLYVDYDGSTATTGSTTLAPIYSQKKPTSPATGQYWYRTEHDKRGEYWDGSVWQPILRMFIGQATTSSGSVASVASYAYQGIYESQIYDSFTGSGSLIVSHNIGAQSVGDCYATIDSLRMPISSAQMRISSGTPSRRSVFALGHYQSSVNAEDDKFGYIDSSGSMSYSLFSESELQFILKRAF